MFEEVAEIETQQTENQGFDYEAWIKQKLSENLMGEEEFHLRHSGATNQRWLKDKEVAVIGLGSIGGTMVQYLMDLGLEKIKLFDPDKYEIHNTAVQGNDLTDIGEYKVEAVRKRMLKHTGINIEAIPEMVHGMETIDQYYVDCAPDIIIIGVDNMEMRNNFWSGLRAKTSLSYPAEYTSRVPELVFDCRMTLGTYTVISLPLKSLLDEGDISNARMKLEYIEQENCFSDEEALQEDCAARSINYTVTHLASYVCAWIDFYSRNLNSRNVLYSILDPRDNASPFKMEHAFDVRSWCSITKSPGEYRMIDKNQKLMEEIDSLEKEVERLKEASEANVVGGIPEIELGVREYTVYTQYGKTWGVIVESNDEYLVLYRAEYYTKILYSEVLSIEQGDTITRVDSDMYQKQLPYQRLNPHVYVMIPNAGIEGDPMNLVLDGSGDVNVEFRPAEDIHSNTEFIPSDQIPFFRKGRMTIAKIYFGRNSYRNFEVTTPLHHVFGNNQSTNSDRSDRIKDVNNGKVFKVLEIGADMVELEGDAGEARMARRTYDRLRSNGTLQWV